MIAVQMGFNMPIMPDDYMLDVLTASERYGERRARQYG